MLLPSVDMNDRCINIVFYCQVFSYTCTCYVYHIKKKCHSDITEREKDRERERGKEREALLYMQSIPCLTCTHNHQYYCFSVVSSTRNWGLAEDLPEIDNSIISSRRLRSNVDDDDEVIS